jgi:type II secretory pathway component PulF
MVYPALVILVALGLTLLLSLTFSRMQTSFLHELDGFGYGIPSARFLVASVWMPPLFLAVVAILAVIALSIPAWRARLRWRLPAFREASLAQLASAMVLMLRNGTTLAEALALAQALEPSASAGKALAHWRSLAAAGKGKAAHWSSTGTPFPPLFIWLVQQGGEDLAAGFQKAAEIYQARASYRIELALYAALPISIILLGQMVLWQATPLFRFLIMMMNALGDAGGSAPGKGD